MDPIGIANPTHVAVARKGVFGITVSEDRIKEPSVPIAVEVRPGVDVLGAEGGRPAGPAVEGDANLGVLRV